MKETPDQEVDRLVSMLRGSKINRREVKETFDRLDELRGFGRLKFIQGTNKFHIHTSTTGIMKITAITRFKQGDIYQALKRLGWSQSDLARAYRKCFHE